MRELIRKHLWSDLGNVPSRAGIYAWYYSPELTDYDIERTIQKLNQLREPSSRQSAEDVVRTLLEERIFGYFREDPYEARLEGPLKPKFQGVLTHQSSPSSSLVARLVEEPIRLRVIREVLNISAPMFASPIYIGMSDNLQHRIAKHKSLIEKLRSGAARGGGNNDDDEGFAARVTARRIPPERLFVYTCEVVSAEAVALDIENVLNRIYYPILGRN
jgi:hypothetical protein